MNEQTDHRPCRALRGPGQTNQGASHPIFWAALAALLLNDHLLKGADVLPGWVTGKLSDIAGLIVAPVVLAVLLRARSDRGRALAVAAISAWFVAVNVWAPAAEATRAIAAWAGFSWQLWVGGVAGATRRPFPGEVLDNPTLHEGDCDVVMLSAEGMPDTLVRWDALIARSVPETVVDEDDEMRVSSGLRFSRGAEGRLELGPQYLTRPVIDRYDGGATCRDYGATWCATTAAPGAPARW